MKEITSPVELCLPDGRLNRAAVGWTRRPLHRANLRGWGRTKRWEYWCVQAPDHVLALTVSSIDYLALHTVWFLAYDGPTATKTAIVPLGRVPLPDTSGGGPIAVRRKDLAISIIPTLTGVTLTARTDRVTADVRLRRPDGHEGLGVVIPWSDRQFQYTVKENTLPAAGHVTVDGTRYAFDPDTSFAVLDHGRGRWPYRTTWNWGSGSGRSDGHLVGLQFGGQWTAGTGMTENAVSVDGVLHPIGEELRWDYDPGDWTGPWRIRGGTGDVSVDVTLTPRHERADRTQAVAIATETHQCFGTWTGSVTVAGRRIRVDGIQGFAEEARMRW